MTLCRLLSAALLAAALLNCPVHASAKADVPALFSEAFMHNDTETLERILAGNFWLIDQNGHISDKEHFLTKLKTKQMVCDYLKLSNQRFGLYGKTRVLTGNAQIRGSFGAPLPRGLIRFTMVTDEGKEGERVILFQLTPVVPTKNCPDGNCEIR